MASPGLLSAAELQEIVARSSNLTERLTGQVVPVPGKEAVAAKRLGRWRQVAANGEQNAFDEILGQSGLRGASVPHLCSLLGEVQHPSGVPLPAWADLLAEIAQAVQADFARVDSPPATRDRTIPFAQLYRPIVALARRKVAADASGLAARMLNRAWAGLEGHLLQRLSDVCSLALLPRFQAFLAVRQSGLVPDFFGEGLPAPGEDATGSLYPAFVRELGSRGLAPFFKDYPVAARLTAQVTHMWIGFVLEFLRRLETDAAEISLRLLGGQPLGKILSIQAGISDCHGGGRSVLILHFASGLAVVYKPRPLQIDAAFSGLLAWFNARGRLPALRPLNILAREAYGWEEFVAHAPCPGRHAAKQFYRRAGVLLYLVHALGGIDFHYENMIASADQPVLVDLEALGHPILPRTSTAGEPGAWLLEDSVLRTGMLPVRERCFGEDRFIVRSALGSPGRQVSALAGIRWRQVNTARMTAESSLTCRTRASHQPRWRGRLLPLRNYLREVVAGFRQTARVLHSDPALTREWQEQIAALRQIAGRLIIHPTLAYAVLIEQSLQPGSLVSGVDRSLGLQTLPAAPGDLADRQAAIAALEALDVPYFQRKPATAEMSRKPPAKLPHDLPRQLAVIQAAAQGRLVLEQGRIRSGGGKFELPG